MRRGAAALAAALVAGSLAAVAPAEAAEKAIWGPAKLPSGASAFPVYRDLGVDTIQFGLSFASTAPARPARPGDPSDPVYRWPADLDAVIAEASASGIEVALLVNRSPAWANGGHTELHAPDPAAFGAFMAAASRRYPAVHRWMIWGEPNRIDRFLPNREDSPVGARAYAPILEASYVALKRVSRRNIVIGGMTWTSGDVKPGAFLDFMRLPNGRRPRLDWFGHNPFPFRFPNLRELPLAGGFRDISDLDTFGNQLGRAYGRRAKFWLSEFLVLSDHASDEFRLFVSRAEQARWLAASYRIADSLDSVAGLGWLSLLDEPAGVLGSNWGLLTSSGRRKPAYHAYRSAPSERLRPRVRVPARLRPGRRLMIRVRPRTTGRVTVAIQRGKLRRVRRVRFRRLSSKRIAIRLPVLRRGRLRVVVRAPRAAEVRRMIRVR